MSQLLKLMAFDAEDLAVISACSQDAVVKSTDLDYHSASGTFVLLINRFAWEAKGSRRFLFKSHERRRSALAFKRVTGVQMRGIQRNDPEQVLNLLAVQFNPDDLADSLSGRIELSFAGTATLVLQVECLECQLEDLGAAWTARAMPRHGT